MSVTAQPFRAAGPFAVLLALCAPAAAADWGRITVSGTSVTLENSRVRARYGEYMTRDVGPKDAIVELAILPGGFNVAGRIDSRAASHSKGKANRISAIEIVRDDARRKTVRLDFGGAAVQEVSLYPDAPWLEITYQRHDVNIFDTAGPKLEYEIFGAAEWAAARSWTDPYPPYPDSYYRREWGSPGPLEYRGQFIVGAYDRGSGHGYGRVMPVADVDVVKLLFSRGFEMFPHYRPRREQLRFTGYLFVVTGGAQEILALGKKLAER